MLTFENTPVALRGLQADGTYIFRHRDNDKLAYRTPSSNVLVLDEFTDYNDFEAVTRFANCGIDGLKVVAIKKMPRPRTLAIDTLLTLAYRYNRSIFFDLGERGNVTPVASKPS